MNGVRRKKHTARKMMSAAGTVCVSVLILLILGRGYIRWIHSSPTFQVRNIVITGNDLLSREEILNLGGVEKGMSMWGISLIKAEQGIRRSPYIEDVMIERRLPGTILIQLTEKTPLALLNVTGQFYCVDREGMVLPSRPGKHYDLPVLSGEFQGGAVAGKYAGGKVIHEGLSFLLTLLAETPSLYPRLSEIVVHGENGIVAYTITGGIPVHFGTGPYEHKMKYLLALMRELEKKPSLRESRYIDLRYRRQVIVGRGI